jgi:hypothetical protein
VVKAPDLYYKERSKLDSFLISTDIYIFFHQYLFGTEAAKIVYAISYLRGVVFDWVKTYIDDFMAYKNNNGKVNILAREPIQKMLNNYKTFKANIQQVFGDRLAGPNRVFWDRTEPD